MQVGHIAVSHLSFMKTRPKPCGFTIIEILMTLVIIALVASLAFPLYGALEKKAHYAACLGNLRSIHAGLNGCMLDHEMVWPQVNSNSFKQNHEEFESWVQTLKPYGVSERSWVCPGDPESMKDYKTGVKESDMTGSYVVTQFDETPNIAFRWNQPWVLEMGGFHGDNKGPNIIMPDGSIQEAPALFIAH
jgi:prepilin-type N-terminal cleavage/methylation domain-containing protein